MGFLGPKYTWTNCREDGALVRTRIDRAHANSEWLEIFPEAKVFHLPRLCSDHNSILLTTNPSNPRGSRPFRFEPAWMKHPNFKTITANIWQKDQVTLESTIMSFQREIQVWNKEIFGNVFQQIKRTKARLLGVQKQLENNADSELLLLESNLQKELLHLLENEECLWKMKSRIDWLLLGDRNTTFFHTSALIRRRRNKISLIKKNEKVWIFN